MAKVSYAKGLEGVIAAESKICKVDGEKSRLYYYGYSISDLVEKSTFEETTYLLIHGRLPNRSQMNDFCKKMRGAREMHPEVIRMIQNFPHHSHAMELLQSSINFIQAHAKTRIEHTATTCNCSETLYQIAQLPGIVTAFHRARNGLEYVAPRSDLSHGANFLWMLKGEKPDEEDGRIMDQCLILHAEHSFNASTFTGRVVASTLSDCYCSMSAAIGSLYGSLHGGANEKVMVMIQDIGKVENVAAWVDKALAEKRKVMGMGHRVYRAKDPRALIIEELLQKLSSKYKTSHNYDVIREIENVFGNRMKENGKNIYPNVDFFSGAVYSLLGIPSSLFTPVFAIARSSGWLAHILEQRADNRLFRPKALYVGEIDLPWLDIKKRN